MHTTDDCENMAYRSFRSEKYSARVVWKVTTGITVLWQPSVQLTEKDVPYRRGFHIGDFYNKTQEKNVPYWGLCIPMGSTLGGSTSLLAPHWGLHIPMDSTLGGSASLSAPHWGLHIGDFHNGTHWKRHSISGAPHPYGLHIGVPHWGLMDLYCKITVKKTHWGIHIKRKQADWLHINDSILGVSTKNPVRDSTWKSPMWSPQCGVNKDVEPPNVEPIGMWSPQYGTCFSWVLL